MAIDLEQIKQKNAEWHLSMENGFHCQECGAGQDEYPSPSDIDNLILEVERLRDQYDAAAHQALYP